MTTDEIITELKNLNEMDMVEVLKAIQDHVEEGSDYKHLINQVFSPRDELDEAKSNLTCAKNDLTEAGDKYQDLVNRVRAAISE